MIQLCARDKSEYDEENPTKNANFEFFVKLCAQKKGINGYLAIAYPLIYRKTDWMEHLLDVNDTFSRPCKASEAWYWVGYHCSAKITKLMLNTAKKGFEFSDLVKSGAVWRTFANFICRSSAYSQTGTLDSCLWCFFVVLFVCLFFECFLFCWVFRLNF